ncbi:glycine cleavage system aminomethyltransferase GcvT [Plasticicumulans sp.]|uniref:glycine cleavage system aminomethyltransferase GcvT n=1 Tax=Plasticicumulans sp. TaxID=2307179 RepID=UPI00395A2016
MSAVETGLAHTPLHDLHLELGARMVPFAGYSMPVQYPAGVLKEHQHTRMAAGLFDVSHMGQVRLDGAQAAAALETLVPVDVLGLPAGRQRYAVFTNDAGGILDDLMIVNAGDHLFLVVNAACKAQDLAHLRARLEPAVTVTELADRALLALQGPAAAEVFLRLAPAAAGMKFMDFRTLEVAGIPCFASRSGYTGEDGFEISVPAARAVELARALLAEPEVAPIGLGARDSLRLEAGLCLYGHELDPTTTPIEAAIGWAIQKVRRTGGARAGGFPGADTILAQFDAGTARLRVGLAGSTRAPVREGAPLLDAGGREVGCVTSGSFGPSAGQPVAMAYVETASATPGTELSALVRGRPVPMTVTTMPFVAQRYHRG